MDQPELLICFVPFLVAAIALLVWAYGDAESRGRDGWLLVLLLMVAGIIPGAVIWLFIRDLYPPQAHIPWPRGRRDRVLGSKARVQEPVDPLRATVYPEARTYRTCLRCTGGRPRNATVCEHCGAEL